MGPTLASAFIWDAVTWKTDCVNFIPSGVAWQQGLVPDHLFSLAQSDLFGVLLMLRQSSHCCYSFWMCPCGPAGTGGWWLCSRHTFWGLSKPWACHHREWTMIGEFETWTMEVRQERESISNVWGDAEGQWDWDGINTDVPLKKKKNLTMFWFGNFSKLYC